MPLLVLAIGALTGFVLGRWSALLIPLAVALAVLVAMLAPPSGWSHSLADALGLAVFSFVTVSLGVVGRQRAERTAPSRRRSSRWEVIDGLTKPTRGRVALWLTLAFLWSLFMVQSLAMDPHHRHFSVGGAVFWLAVLLCLLACAWRTWDRRRSQ
jgi:hypothetical protein